MAIIISQKGKHAQKVEKSYFEQEDYLQKYIYDNPESIPLYDIKEDVRLLILAREFPTNSGPIDAIGTDKDGEIYLVETKLHKNPDKRTVVAQVLDYGASLWRASRDFNDFTAKLNEAAGQQFNLSLNEKLQEFFAIAEEEVAVLLDNIARNLNDGNFKFVVLMDHLHGQLKDLIVFINQNSKFDIFAVELEYYKYDQYEIMIPKLFGAEVKKDVRGASSGPRKQWSETDLLQDARKKLEDKYVLFEKIYLFCKAKADKINFGTGSSYGSFSPIFSKLSSKSLFTLGTDKRLSFNFGWITPDNETSAELFKNKLETIGFQLPQDYKKLYPSFYVETWGPKTEGLIGVLKEIN